MLTDLTVKQFLEQVASGEAVPGGGCVAALSAALSAGLSQMVCLLTVGRKGNAPALDDKMSALTGEAAAVRATLISAIDRDAAAYTAVMNAYRLPKASDEEKRLRHEAIQEALKEAARVPLSVAEMCADLLKLAKAVVSEGNKNALSDGLVAALTARAGMIGALYNVRINLMSIEDSAFRDDTARKVAMLEKEATEGEYDVLAAAASRVTMEKGG